MKKITVIDIFVERLLIAMKGMSERELSFRSDVPYSTVKSIMQKKTKSIDYTTILKLADGLGVDPWELVHYERLTAGYLNLR